MHCSVCGCLFTSNVQTTQYLKAYSKGGVRDEINHKWSGCCWVCRCRKTHASLAAITDRFRRDQNQTLVLPLNESVRLLITGDALLMYSVPRDIRQTFSYFFAVEVCSSACCCRVCVCVSFRTARRVVFFFRVKVASLSKKNWLRGCTVLPVPWLFSVFASIAVLSVVLVAVFVFFLL